MARRTNLTTVRSSFSWSVSWMDSHLYSNILWLDYRVSDYLVGIFYTFKMPTSNYLITRFFDNFVLVETDLFFFCFDRLSGLLSSKFYFSYFLSIINSFFSDYLTNNNEFVHKYLVQLIGISIFSGVTLLIALICSVYLTNMKSGYSLRRQDNQFSRNASILNVHVY